MTSTKSTVPLKLAVLISGGGTTLRNLLEKIEAGSLRAEILLVISSDPKASGLEFARQAGISCETVVRKSFDTLKAYSEAIFSLCSNRGVELVVMGGFLNLVQIPPDFENRVVNIHPALIPAFCGKGFYGSRCHEAVLEYGVKVSGCTVHFADNQYDHGPIILQKTVPVLDEDTPETLAARIFAAECEAYPEAIGLIAEGKVRVEGRIVRINNND